ncbi:alanine racemase [Acidobacteriota bacterium]
MKSYIEINAANLVHNLQLFRDHTKKKIMFVVKANAYGHGLKEVITITKDLTFIDYYAVDSLDEALTIREIDEKKNILIIGWADREEIKEMITQRFEIIILSIDHLKIVDEIAKKLQIHARCHFKVEIGTSRLGMKPGELIDLFNGSDYEYIDFTGVYSHFANIEDTTDHTFARRQLKVFNDVIAQIDGKRNDRLLKHFSCSASTLLFPETYFDIVRIGISVYGFWSSKETYISYIEKNKHRIALKPVLSWMAKVAQVKHRKQGEHIGYGLTYRTFSDARIAVIPVGYYDGYDRKLSNIANIIIRGVKAPVRGRVCMNMFMAEVTHIKDVREGDRVVLIGEEGDEKIGVDYLADLAGTINYEMVSRLNPLILRKIV